MRNVGSNWIVVLGAMVATYLLTPFIIRTLGAEGYGVWTLITAITGYVNLLAIGVPAASVRYVAQHIAEKDSVKANQTIGSCAAVYVITGSAALLLCAAMLGGFGWFAVPASLQGDAVWSFAVMSLTVSAGFIGLLPEGILFAHHDFVPRNLVRLGGVLLRLVLTVATLAVVPSLFALALVQLVLLAVDFTASWLVIRRRHPSIRLNLGLFEWAVVRRISSFSLYVFLLTAGSRLSFESDSIVIGAMLGVGAIPFYVVANSVIVYLIDLVTGIAAVIAPTATALSAKGRLDELRHLVLRWSKVALSITLMAGLFLIVLGPSFLAWWIDPSFEKPSGIVLQTLMVSSLIFLPVRGVVVPALIGLGKPKVPTYAFLAAGIVNVLLSLALAGPLGLFGVALGTAIPNAVFAVVVLVAACRELGISSREYLLYVVPKPLAGSIPVLALLVWFRLGVNVQSLAGLALAGASMMTVFGVMWVFFVYRRDPYLDVAEVIRLRLWSRA